MNEIQAAYGLVQLKRIDEYMEKRKSITKLYREGLKDIDGISFFEDIEGVRHTYTYFPILVNQDRYGISRDELYERLREIMFSGSDIFIH